MSWFPKGSPLVIDFSDFAGSAMLAGKHVDVSCIMITESGLDIFSILRYVMLAAKPDQPGAALRHGIRLG